MKESAKSDPRKGLGNCIENTAYGSNHLRIEGFSERVVQGVYAFSNLSDAPYLAFIAGIAAHASLLAIFVKLSDNEDNADPQRLAKLDEVKRNRLLAKYEPSMAMLREAAQAQGWHRGGLT